MLYLNVLKLFIPHDVNLQLYQVHAVTEGTDAQATVSVKIEEKGKTTVGQAADTDTLVASANAYINALNKMIIKRDKTAPMEQENQKGKRNIKWGYSIKLKKFGAKIWQLILEQQTH
jgi:biopolymer transport protein ExbD